MPSKTTEVSDRLSMEDESARLSSLLLRFAWESPGAHLQVLLFLRLGSGLLEQRFQTTGGCNESRRGCADLPSRRSFSFFPGTTSLEMPFSREREGHFHGFLEGMGVRIEDNVLCASRLTPSDSK